MIVISAGMQKAASASYFNLTNDLLIAAGRADVRQLRKRFGFGRFMTEVNCNVGPLRAYKLAWLSLPHWAGDSFVVKTHEAPSPSARILLSLGIAKASFIHREHGARLREQGIASDTQFDKFLTLEAAIRFVASLLPIAKAWIRMPGVHVVRYEAFRGDVFQEAIRLCRFLELDLDEARACQIAARYDVSGKDAAGLGPHTHYHQGIAGRWKTAMTTAQKALCQELFGRYLLEMGFSAS